MCSRERENGNFIPIQITFLAGVKWKVYFVARDRISLLFIRSRSLPPHSQPSPDMTIRSFFGGKMCWVTWTKFEGGRGFWNVRSIGSRYKFLGNLIQTVSDFHLKHSTNWRDIYALCLLIDFPSWGENFGINNWYRVIASAFRKVKSLPSISTFLSPFESPWLPP